MTAPRVLVTGGGRGIGRAIALRFAKEGGRVVVAARTSAELDKVVEEIGRAGGKGCAAQMNVREDGSVEAAVWRAVEFLEGAIDVLVNDAGVYDIKPFEKLDAATWMRAIEVNLNGAFFVTQECLDPLLESERAHIFNIAAGSTRRPAAGHVAYWASKCGLQGFSDALREDLRAHEIRVSTVHPSATNTSLLDKLPGQIERNKMLEPEAVAEVVWKAWQSAPNADVDDLEIPPRS